MSYVIQGHVINSVTGAPIPDAQIFEAANPDNGTQTDENGNFTFTADDDVSLTTVTAPGMQPITEDPDGLQGTVSMVPIQSGTSSVTVSNTSMVVIILVLAVVVYLLWKYKNSLTALLK